MFSIYLYSLSNTRGIPLPVIVGPYNYLYSFGITFPDNTYLEIFGFSILIIAFLSLLLYKKNKFVIISTFALVFLSLITFKYSPLKSIQYLLTTLSFGWIDVGVIFRTPRLFVSIAIILLLSLLGISLYGIFQINRNRLTKSLVVTLLFFLLLGSIYETAYINNHEKKVTLIPQEYSQIANWLKDNEGSFRSLWIPRTGRYPPGENPVWFKTKGWAIPESSFKIRTYFYYRKPMEYLYPFLLHILENNKTKSAAYILSYIGVKYLVIHDDYWWDRLQGIAKRIKENLDSSPYFKLRVHTKHIYVYENLMATKSIHIGTIPVIIDGGLKSLSQFIESSNLNSNYAVFFTDLPIPKDVIYSAPIIVTPSIDNLKFNLLVNLLIANKKEKYIIVPAHFTEGIEKGKWHPYYIDNPHHAEWEIFYSWNFPNASFEHSFKFSWGFVGSKNPGDFLKIPVNIKKEGNYILLVRYFENDKGGKIDVSIDNKTFYITTKGKENAFRWFIGNVTLSEGFHILTIKNVNGLNAINIVVIIPEEEFVTLYNEVDELLKHKKIISFNLVKNSSFDEVFNNTSNFENKKLNNTPRTITVSKLEYKNGKYFVDVLTHIQNVSFCITIPEQYHGGWVAIVDGKKTIKPIPQLFVNNFWIKTNTTGLHHIEIKFYPQDTWNIIYLTNGIIVLAIIFINCFVLVRDMKMWKKR